MGISDQFTRTLNYTLGKPLGNRIAAPAPRRVAPLATYAPRIRDVKQDIRRGIIDLSPNVEDYYESVFGERATGGGPDSEPGLRERLRQEYRKGQEEFTNQLSEQIRSLGANTITEANRIPAAAALQEEIANAPSKGQLEVVEMGLKRGLSREDAELLAGVRDNKNAFSKVTSKIGEIVSLPLVRPFNATMGMAFEGTGEELKRQGKGTGWLDTLGGMLKGAQYGITGHRQYDPGKVMENLFPSAPQPVKVGGAVGLNLFADPIKYGGFAAAKYSTRTNKAMRTLELQDEVADAVYRSVTDAQMDLGKYATSGSTLSSHQIELQKLQQKARDLVERITIDVQKGGRRGHMNLGGSRKQVAYAIANDVVNNARTGKLDDFERFVEEYTNHVLNKQGVPFDPVRMASMEAISPHFVDFMRGINQKATGKMTLSDWRRVIGEEASRVRGEVDKPLVDLTETLYQNVGKSYYNAPAVRLGNKTFKIPFLGKALKSYATKGVWDLEDMRQMSHAGMFPGKLALLINRGRSHGTQKYEEFQKLVDDWATRYTRKERVRIQEMAHNPLGAFPNEPHMQDGLDFFRHHMGRMFDEESVSGVLNRAPDQKLSNYTFVWNKKGNPHRLREFKDERRTQIHKSRTASGYTVAEAKAAGFKPVEDAFQMLLARQMKSNRDIAKALFRGDLLENYGFVARGLSTFAKNSRKLEAFGNDTLPENLRNLADPTKGDSWYLPQSLNDAYKQFDELSKFSSDYKVIRWIRKMTNFIKSGATVYNPGYHPRNMISDFIMGLLDNVGLKDHLNIMRKAGFNRKGGRAGIHLRNGAEFELAPGVRISGDDAMLAFKNNASGGGYAGREWGGNIAEQAATRVNRGVRKVSEAREDFGRFVHFMTALKQEYRALQKQGIRNPQRLMEKATENAAYRVNHFKFDYGALTKWEQRVMKQVVPFYTFTRKALPTLAESFITNPKWLTRYQKLREARDGDEAKNFMSFEIPQWAKDTGYFTAFDEAEPQIATMDVLPTDAFANVIPAEKSMKGLFGMGLEQANPLAQMIIEPWAGKHIFSDRKIGNKPIDWVNYYGGKLGGPLHSGYEDIWSSDADWKENLLTSRAFGLGLPLHRIPQRWQDYQTKLWEDKNIQQPFDKFNEGAGKKKGIRVSLSKGRLPDSPSSYKVVDDNTGRIIYQGINPFVALERAKKYSGSEISTNMKDWNDTIGHDAGVRVYRSERKDGTSYRVKQGKTIKDFSSPNQALTYANQLAQQSGSINERTLQAYEEFNSR